ncbi:hypothetical protein CLOM_g22056 [Closterium sp. NIES-68]|nr:hypothetical protein CLOM_g22056 [Closterium sp. NIES-68]GJP77756.1 hypothetical protein CLOP_g8107 [Closterium sp. NIES-67]
MVLSIHVRTENAGGHGLEEASVCSVVERTVLLKQDVSFLLTQELLDQNLPWNGGNGASVNARDVEGSQRRPRLAGVSCTVTAH